MRQPRVIAHRGFGSAEPENTLRAVRQAIVSTVDGIELDVHASRDGEIVVIHDFTVDRTTDGSGSVAQLTLQELQAFDAGEGESIPTLQEVIDEVAGHGLLLNVEVKPNGIEEQVLQVLSRNNGACQVIVSSFLWPVLETLRKLDKEVKTGLLYGAQLVNPVKIAHNLGVTALHPHHQFVTAELVEQCHDTGLEVNPWTVNDHQELHRLIGLQVDGIITDFPCRLQELLQK
jgi:glycerophosphoryl diester phosphodiesterase